MAENRIRVDKLVTGLCQRADITESVASNFINTIFDIIRDNLRRDKLVKVRGLGTFKLVDISPRESTAIGTNERYTIDAYTKVSFTPDPVLRDAVNKPFAEFETVILNDGVDLSYMSSTDELPDTAADAEDELPAQAEDVVSNVVETANDLPDDESDSVEQVGTDDENLLVHDGEAEVKAMEAAATDEVPVAVPQAEILKPAPTPVMETASKPATKPAEPASTASDETTPKIPQQVDETVIVKRAAVVERADVVRHADLIHQNDRGGCRRAALTTLLALVMLVVGYLLGYYFHPFTLPDIFPSQQPQPAVTPTTPVVTDTVEAVPQTAVVDTVDNAPTAADTLMATADNLTAVVDTLAAATDYPQLDGGEYLIVGVDTIEVMRPGKTLLNISIKHYGSKNFVDYICVMNNIENPDIVPIDKKLKIPRLHKKE